MSELLLVLPSYLTWHYSRSPREYAYLWARMLWFVVHVFSMPFLLATLFSPWRRLDEKYPRQLDLGAWGEVLVVNLLMRLVGFVVRMAVFTFGVLALVFVLLGGAVGFIVWLAAPALVPVFAVIGTWMLVVG
ncbi:MAG: hypothetical protein Q8R39_00800 [bacterium]|nr:hypothetical protein [bacterium]MDZ4284955.1 hypothetical protein [Patescibacteria group bacterium]